MGDAWIRSVQGEMTLADEYGESQTRVIIFRD